MLTPFGRFRWGRLPFGLKVSSGIFHIKLRELRMTLSSLGVVKRRRSQNKPGAENQRAEAAMSREKYCSQRQQDLLEKKK
ncbi:hypothetical protein RRG08_046600 [Elysia crispata]|uniref:Uncharacterized protein n=1 Tax=Elysia crispata TaxID=231223 RepID=A0AAE1APD4_9GAST|nr:hypothetical protein RRG08_046600 [Elysia crispata]